MSNAERTFITQAVIDSWCQANPQENHAIKSRSAAFHFWTAMQGISALHREISSPAADEDYDQWADTLARAINSTVRHPLTVAHSYAIAWDDQVIARACVRELKKYRLTLIPQDELKTLFSESEWDDFSADLAGHTPYHAGGAA